MRKSYSSSLKKLVNVIEWDVLSLGVRLTASQNVIEGRGMQAWGALRSGTMDQYSKYWMRSRHDVAWSFASRSMAVDGRMVCWKSGNISTGKGFEFDARRDMRTIAQGNFIPNQQHHQETPTHMPRPEVLSSTKAIGHSPEKVPLASMETYADAEECDEAMEDLEDVRKRVRNWKRLPPGHVPLTARIKHAVNAVAHGTYFVVSYTISIPGRVYRFYSLPKEERRATYAKWWLHVKNEAKHYWLGTKLLWKDVQIASRILKRVLQGKTLSRRERQQLTRTTADIFRLVPMMVFLVVPFMELLLPVALKLFPNMLPSTFEDKLKKEEEMKRRIGARLEIARFLQDTVAEMAGDMTAHRSGDTRTSAAELYEFMQRVRAGENVDTSQLLKFAKLFNDEITLDNLERVQLVSLCRFVGISPFGTDAFLKSRLRSHLLEIKDDDRDIQEEGIENLTEDELRQACRARGLRAPFGEGAVKFMRHQLDEWLDWSLNRSLPSSLLLLSRAFTVTTPVGVKGGVDMTSIRETLSTMPEEVVEDVELFATSDGGDKNEAYERKIELLEREEELIREEQELEVDFDLPISETTTGTPAEKAATAAARAVVKEAAASSLVDFLDRESQEERSLKAAAAKQAKMQKILNALAALASSSGVTSEREAFMDLVEKEIERLQSQLGNRGAGMVFTKGQLAVDRTRMEEVLGQRRLEDKVTSILKRVEKELDFVDEKIGSKFRLLDIDNDGVISEEELRLAMTFLKEQLGEDELVSMLQQLQSDGDSSSGFDVNKLMQLAFHNEEEEDTRQVVNKE